MYRAIEYHNAITVLEEHGGDPELLDQLRAKYERAQAKEQYLNSLGMMFRYQDATLPNLARILERMVNDGWVPPAELDW